MKKIEAVIKRRNFPIIRAQLNMLGTYMVDKRNLDDSSICDKSSGSRVGSNGIKYVPLAKIEVVVPDKDARSTVEMISGRSGLSSEHGGKIFISEMEEVVEMSTLDGSQDLEVPGDDEVQKKMPKRGRFVPLQKYTLQRLHDMYEENKEVLHGDHRVRSFSDFVNYCIMRSLPDLERQLRNPIVTYNDRLGDP